VTHLYDHAAVSGACFNPRPGPTLPLDGCARPVDLHLDDGSVLGGLLCCHLSEAPVLYLLHDTTDIVADFVPYWVDWAHAAGANLFLLDYPGYASSAGTPTFSSCREAARKGLEFLLKHDAEIPSVVLLGRGLGSVFALDLLSMRSNKVRGLVLENGLVDVADWIAERVPWENTGFKPEDVMAELDQAIMSDLSTQQALEAADIPALILYSIENAESAQQLADWADTNQLELLQNGDAGSAQQLNRDTYIDALRRFLADVAPRGTL
jgi:pimeloyl-ACP methyl ester carboxylesterase